MYLQLHFLLYRLTTYSSVRIFKKLPNRTAALKNDKKIFPSALRKYLLALFSIPKNNL